MKENDIEKYRNIFQSRIEGLKTMLLSTDFPPTPPFAPLIYLKNLLVVDGGWLYDLHVEICQNLTGDKRMLYDLKDEKKKRLQLDYRLINAFDEVGKKTSSHELYNTPQKLDQGLR